MSNGNWNDGAIIYGARKLDIYHMDNASGGSGSGSTWTGLKNVTAISEQITVRRTGRELSQYNQSGQPSGGAGTGDFVTGETVIQVADITKYAIVSDAFTIQLDGATSESFVVTSVSVTEEQFAARKQSISFRKLYVATGPTLTA